MAFRQFQRLGGILPRGKTRIVDQGSTILQLKGQCSGTSLSQSVIRHPSFEVNARQLSSLTCLHPSAKSPKTKQTFSLSSISDCKYSPLLVHNVHKTSEVNPLWGSLGVRHFSFKQTDTDVEKSDGDKPEKKTVFQRFKETYKEYGKVLVGVHLATSAVWLGSFYYLASTGIDIVPLLEKLGFGEKVINTLGKPGLGHLAVAYLLYKLATPARYTVTIVGTQMTVKQFRKLGYLQPIKKEDSLRSLFKEGKSQVQERYGDMKDEMRTRMISRRENFRREFSSQQERFKARHSKLRNDIERRAKLRQRTFKNGRNGHHKP